MLWSLSGCKNKTDTVRTEHWSSDISDTRAVGCGTAEGALHASASAARGEAFTPLRPQIALQTDSLIRRADENPC